MRYTEYYDDQFNLDARFDYNSNGLLTTVREYDDAGKLRHQLYYNAGVYITEVFYDSPNSWSISINIVSFEF